ncbi:neutral alpha-glucosidase C-like isoform X1 [Carcharodon carcharias]|uniref:neutral alpha-glucosidase C-like isoform X1 n=1 Tax=Carcharodon carcharias TaxID=13397 RepID=UPI001B7E1873|nr:neutral alpha-glucosidase C-like isoform X1 [Carcharodon carcharias]
MESSIENTEEASALAEAVESNKFKTTGDIAFYRRQKKLLPGNSPYHALLDTLELSDCGATLQLLNEENKVSLFVELFALEDHVIRIKVNELKPMKPRYEVPDVILNELLTQRLSIVSKDGLSVTLATVDGCSQVLIIAKPFRMDVRNQGELPISVNSLGFLYFEHLRKKSQDEVNTRGSLLEGKRKRDTKTQKESEEDLGLWKEQFHEFIDTKTNGPTSIGLDFSLHGFEHVYGIPEHTENLRLKTTSQEEPYRLYNLDVFACKLYSRISVYGSVPLLLAHKPKQTMGIFWLNASETLVDISMNTENKSALGKTKKLKTDVEVLPRTDVRWMSESGIIDTYILMGPSPFDVFNQYSKLTGPQAFPPLFALGHHQCRYSYKDENDVKQVDAGFDVNDIPYDAIWLDIDHTEGKRYFTWDRTKFPSPREMQEHLRAKDRKLVVISDPHIKVDKKYPFYCEAKSKNYFVMDKNGEVYRGSCWPGVSAYLDFTNPIVRNWYANKHRLDQYEDSTDILFMWNDMNEPTVFDGPELTMHKQALHIGGWEHREVHNLYGFYQQWATAEGLIRRSGGIERPFVLTRSFFAGSQRYGAVWTGDNVAEWSYLKISIPMLLNLSITGISFCGADVGGFVQNPEPELLVRWYQAAAYQPFFRNHSHTETERREPWLFGEDNTRIIRETIRERYALLPFWYTLFYMAHIKAEPIIRPLWVEFPEEVNTFAVDDEYMIGEALLIHPVSEAGVTEVNVFLPGMGELWYHLRTLQRFDGEQTLRVSVTLDSVPVYQRGGTIIPRKTQVLRSTKAMEMVSYILYVALNFENSAKGNLFLDDGHSFNYQSKNQFLLRRFSFKDNTFSAVCADERGQYCTDCVVERVLVMGAVRPTCVTAHCPDGQVNPVYFTYNVKKSLLNIEGLQFNLGCDWMLKLHY